MVEIKQEPQNIFNNYLTEHLGYTIDHKSRQKKKQWLKSNYQNILPNDLNAQILEVGPGHGELLEFLIEDMSYKNVTGVDISAEVVDFCNKILPNSTNLVTSDFKYFTDRPNTFDCIMMLHVLEHVPKSQTHELLKALCKSLKPGGLMVVEVPNMANPLVGINFRYADFTHEVGFTDASLRYVLLRSGFSQISVHPSKVPTNSPARIIQSLLRSIVDGILSLIIKVYIPSSKQIISTAIYAITTK
jgi:2-polyprenyl-3-methyl-5-hydroxy-6-metoxy-1,4-benzoquinol methylase